MAHNSPFLAIIELLTCSQSWEREKKSELCFSLILFSKRVRFSKHLFSTCEAQGPGFGLKRIAKMNPTTLTEKYKQFFTHTVYFCIQVCSQKTGYGAVSTVIPVNGGEGIYAKYKCTLNQEPSELISALSWLQATWAGEALRAQRSITSWELKLLLHDKSQQASRSSSSPGHLGIISSFSSTVASSVLTLHLNSAYPRQ